MPHIEIRGYEARALPRSGRGMSDAIFKALADAPYRNKTVVEFVHGIVRNSSGEAQQILRIFIEPDFSDADLADLKRRMRSVSIAKITLQVLRFL